jgi:hypothetical protein
MFYVCRNDTRPCASSGHQGRTLATAKKWGARHVPIRHT